MIAPDPLVRITSEDSPSSSSASYNLVKPSCLCSSGVSSFSSSPPLTTDEIELNLMDKNIWTDPFQLDVFSSSHHCGKQSFLVSYQCFPLFWENLPRCWSIWRRCWRWSHSPSLSRKTCGKTAPPCNGWCWYKTLSWSCWRYISHDEELVRALAPYDVLHVEELGDPELPLRHTECQLAVPDVTFHVEYLFIIDFKRNDDIFHSKCISNSSD